MSYRRDRQDSQRSRACFKALNSMVNILRKQKLLEKQKEENIWASKYITSIEVQNLNVVKTIFRLWD